MFCVTVSPFKSSTEEPTTEAHPVNVVAVLPVYLIAVSPTDRTPAETNPDVESTVKTVVVALLTEAVPHL